MLKLFIWPLPHIYKIVNGLYLIPYFALLLNVVRKNFRMRQVYKNNMKFVVVHNTRLMFCSCFKSLCNNSLSKNVTRDFKKLIIIRLYDTLLLLQRIIPENHKFFNRIVTIMVIFNYPS